MNHADKIGKRQFLAGSAALAGASMLPRSGKAMTGSSSASERDGEVKIYQIKDGNVQVGGPQDVDLSQEGDWMSVADKIKDELCANQGMDPIKAKDLIIKNIKSQVILSNMFGGASAPTPEEAVTLYTYTPNEGAFAGITVALVIDPAAGTLAAFRGKMPKIDGIATFDTTQAQPIGTFDLKTTVDLYQEALDSINKLNRKEREAKQSAEEKEKYQRQEFEKMKRRTMGPERC